MLFKLYYADQIAPESFAEENRRIATQIKTLQIEVDEYERDLAARESAVDKFDQVAELLATMDLEAIWEETTPAERRTLVEDLVGSVCIYPDRITVQVAGASPFTVGLDEVGLTRGCIPVTSEARREPVRVDDADISRKSIPMFVLSIDHFVRRISGVDFLAAIAVRSWLLKPQVDRLC